MNPNSEPVPNPAPTRPLWTRRQFLRGTAVTTVGTIIAPFVGGCAPQPATANPQEIAEATADSAAENPQGNENLVKKFEQEHPDYAQHAVRLCFYLPNDVNQELDGHIVLADNDYVYVVTAKHFLKINPDQPLSSANLYRPDVIGNVWVSQPQLDSGIDRHLKAIPVMPQDNFQVVYAPDPEDDWVILAFAQDPNHPVTPFEAAIDHSPVVNAPVAALIHTQPTEDKGVIKGVVYKGQVKSVTQPTVTGGGLYVSSSGTAIIEEQSDKIIGLVSHALPDSDEVVITPLNSQAIQAQCQVAQQQLLAVAH